MADKINGDRIRKAINRWLESAEHDFYTAEITFKNGRYAWSLFLAHLVLEKTCKALWVLRHHDIVVPRTHNLRRLAEACDMNLTAEEEKELVRITEFNLESRYPEEQNEFYKTCTKTYASTYFRTVKRWRKRILVQLKKS